jgi:Xaa-Pro aminopeptidase
MRIIKDKFEIGLIEKNMRILANVFGEAGEVLSAGISESVAAAQLELRLRLNGGEGKAFDFIVASGLRSALPHGVAGKRRIGKNDFVTLDWGCLLEGYHTDNTRNFSFGKPKRKLAELHRIVLEANRKATEAVAPGVRLADIDRAARSVIEHHRYGNFFGHGTGHGVGLDIHEAPTVGLRSKGIAKEGMVFTIEPGIYLPGIGGVRIEDMVLVTKTGCKVLSRNIPQELSIL